MRKWRWVELDTLPPQNDVRPESRRPQVDTITLHEQLDASHDREAGRSLVDQLPHKSLTEWEAAYDAGKTSLGVIVPRRVIAVEHEAESEDWTEKEKAALSQMSMFADTPNSLQKVPYRFRYHFEDSDGRECRMAIRDWELGMLFLKMRDAHGETEAVNKVKQKYLDQVCAADKDTRFFVGTMYPYNQWMVVGVFWPPKLKERRAGQGSLFEEPA
ncbi:MAG: hypothetical protein JSS66_08635 [Armatimonadetes bacterium]|nr:hypothetical protein [Armatimonadota bacterium]